MKNKTRQKASPKPVNVPRTPDRKPILHMSMNLLPIENIQKTIRVAFTPENGTDRQRFKIIHLPPQALMNAGLSTGDAEFLYSDLNICDGPEGVEVELTEYAGIARAWYNKCIRDFLSEHSYLMQPNYLNDTVFWFREEKKADYVVFNKYTLKVVNEKLTGGLSLMVSWSGTSAILLKSVEELTRSGDIDPEWFGKVVFNKTICHFNRLPEEGLRNQDKVFPAMNLKLRKALGIDSPYSFDLYSYKSDIRKIEDFFNLYLNKPEFRALVPIQQQWFHPETSSVDHIDKPVTALVFGNHETGTDVYGLMKKHGPYRMIPESSFTSFFIYHEKDLNEVNHLKSYLNGQNGSGGLMNYTKTTVFFNDHFNITYKNNLNPFPEIEQAIRNLNLIQGTRYYAFYLSRFSRFGNTLADNELYYKIRQSLLMRGIVSQTIDKQKMLSSGINLSYWIPNIAFAAIAKLGGIPWKPDSNSINELVVGFGLYTSVNFRRKYTGASVCFSNDGSFLEFDAYPSDEPWQLAATLEKALKKYLEKNQSARRLIIHYYKEPSGREFDPVERMLDALEVRVPVIIVRVARSNTNPYYVNDHSSVNCIAPNGTFVRLFRNNYLLFLNDRHNPTHSGNSAPDPIRVGLFCSDKSITDDKNTVKEVLQQLNDFCYMHWRSIKQHRYPVTIEYARMLAEQASWFTDEPLPEEVKGLVWFI